jgi:hypothetical protein
MILSLVAFVRDHRIVEDKRKRIAESAPRA